VPIKKEIHVLLSHCSGERHLEKALTSVVVTNYVEMVTHLTASILNDVVRIGTILMVSCKEYKIQRACFLLDMISSGTT
jgi:hypothetical protein